MSEFHLTDFDFIHPKSYEIAEFARQKLDVMKCHDWEHTERVLRVAKYLMREEQAEAYGVIIELAALLHDICRPDELNSEKKCCHAQMAAELAPEILTQFGVEKQWHKAISLAILRHRFRSHNRPKSIPEKIIFDADKLDALGAIGIARALYFSGRMGVRIHNPAHEAKNALDYSNDDTAYREYLIKLRHLPEQMTTITGRTLAEKRLAFTTHFFEVLNQETYGIMP